ncbi:hypothetical protein ACU5AX_02895 [Sphingomonas sp. XXL09]|uniref:hypothetical protein n=1 Tax=Sphingomonas sp. XXL09 TaxID=3457787 RepID=UPI00406BA64A
MNILNINDFLEANNGNPGTHSIFQGIFNAMFSSIEGKIAPKFYVYPIDTGLGKSTLIKSFLAGWKAAGFEPEGSVLIALNTKAEIVEFATDCGLDVTDYAALTTDEEVNIIGAGHHRAASVPVLFTTQAMIRQRLAQKKFAQAEEFFFKGRPRSLRIWDEQALRAEPVHLPLDTIGKLYEPVRPYFPEWVEELEAFVAEVKGAAPNTIIRVPNSFGSGLQFKGAEGGVPSLSSWATESFKALRAAMGRKVRICAGKLYGITLVGSGPALPDDLAPLFILDASARIGDSYALWGDKSPVQVMPALTRDYSNLTVRLWKTACGNTVLEQPEKRDHLFRGIAKALDLNAEPTLVIGKKARSTFDIHKGLQASVANPDDVSFLHWGRHYGTNEYRQVKRMVVIGAHQARDTMNLAIYAAASGIDVDQLAGDEGVELSRPRMKQNLLQAFSRGHLREGTNGQCGECVVYFVAPPSVSPEQLVRETFPGCQIEEWHPFDPVLVGQAKAVFDVLKAWVDREGALNPYPKMIVRTAVGIESPSRFGQVLANPNLVTALAKIGVTIEHKAFRRAPVAVTTADVVGARAKWLMRHHGLAKAA